MTRGEVAQAVAQLLRDIGIKQLDDDLVKKTREIMAAPVNPDPAFLREIMDAPVVPATDPDFLDRGGPEPQGGGGTSESGGVRVGDDPGPIRI